MDIQTNLVFDEDTRPGAPAPHVFVARFPDCGDAEDADIAFRCASLNLGERVTDWREDKPRGRETAARWALFFDGRENHTVRVGIIR